MALTGLFEHIKERLGVNADPERPEDQGHQRHDLAEAQILQDLVLGILAGAKHRALVEPQHVRGAQNDARDRHRGPAPVGLVRALQNRELADEAVQQRQADGRQHDDHEQRGIDGHDVRDPAKFLDLARVAALVDQPDNQEERAGGNAVVDLLNHASLQAVRVQGKDSQRAESQVAHGGVGDQLLHVLLHQRDQRPVNDGDEREPHHHLHHASHRCWLRAAGAAKSG